MLLRIFILCSEDLLVPWKFSGPEVFKTFFFHLVLNYLEENDFDLKIVLKAFEHPEKISELKSFQNLTVFNLSANKKPFEI